MDGEPVFQSLYVYSPNKGSSIFFTIAYAVSAASHIWQCHRYKSWRLTGFHPACAVLFAVGYGMRACNAFDNYVYNGDKAILFSFIFSQVFIYVCPPLLELANYHVLGRIMYYVPYFAPFPSGRVLSIFGGLMAIVETLNALGVALATNPGGSSQDLGSHLVVVAIALQLVVIVIFVVIAAIFHWRYHKANIHVNSVKTPLVTLYVSMALIFIRGVYRLVEHFGLTKAKINDMEAMRKLSPLLRYEVFFLIFESSLMLVNSFLWNIWSPARYLPRDYRVYLAQDGTEVEGEEEADDRPFLKKAGHILTFGVLFHKKRGAQRNVLDLDHYPVVNSQY